MLLKFQQELASDYIIKIGSAAHYGDTRSLYGIDTEVKVDNDNEMAQSERKLIPLQKPRREKLN